MWQTEIRHESDKIFFARLPPDAGVVPALFTDRRRRSPLVVMTRVDRAVVGQREELLVDGSKQSPSASALKIRASCPADEEGIPSEDVLVIGRDERQTSVSVSGRRADFEGIFAEA